MFQLKYYTVANDWAKMEPWLSLNIIRILWDIKSAEGVAWLIRVRASQFLMLQTGIAQRNICVKIISPLKAMTFWLVDVKG